MTREFKNANDRHREVYTSPCDLAGLAKIISSNTDDYDRWSVYVTIGCPGNYIFGPCRVEINMLDGVWRVQSAETIYDLRTGNGHTNLEGKLQGNNMAGIYSVLKKVYYK